MLGPDGARHLATDRVEGDDPLAPFSPTAARHLLRTDGFPHVADIMVGSFYDPVLDEGCAFEELISFHGGLGGPQTRPFILSSAALPLPDEPIIGAAAVHALLQAGGSSCRTGPPRWRPRRPGRSPRRPAAARTPAFHPHRRMPRRACAPSVPAMRYTTLSAVVLASLAVAACGGDSKAEAAKSTVCNARADISEQVDQLKGMTASTFTTGAASKSLSAIRSSLTTSRAPRAISPTTAVRRSQQANQKFAGEVQDVVKQVFRSTSAAEAKSQLTTAFQQLADTYQQTYAQIDCS